MKILALCFLFTNYYPVVAQPMELNPRDLRYLTEIQKFFCAEPTTCSSESYSTSGTQSTSGLYSNKEVTQASSSSEFMLLNLPVIPPPILDPNCCGQCSCDENKCDVTDTCCLEALEKMFPRNKSNVRMTCNYPQLRPYVIIYPNTGIPELMFTACPTGSISDTETVNKCENSDSYSDIDTKIPVTDSTAMYTYKNRYCAYCHKITGPNLHYWEAEIECIHGILKPRSINSVVSEVLDTESCNIKYSRPTSLGTNGSFNQCKIVISKCNVTGHWKIYDPVIEAGCLAFSATFNFRYRNVFCYLCNTNDSIGPVSCIDKTEPRVFVDFKALIKFDPDVSTSSIPQSKVPGKCSLNQIYDPVKKHCRELECLFPKTITKGRCKNLVEYLGGINYGMFLKLSPPEDVKIPHSAFAVALAGDIDDVIRSWLSVKLQNTIFLSLNLYIYAKIYTTPSEILEDISYTIEFFVVYVEIAFETRSPISTDVIDYMLGIQDTFIDTGDISQNANGVKYKVEIDVYNVSDVGASKLFDSAAGELNLIVKQNALVQTDYPKTILSVVYTCPLVQINSTEFNITRTSYSIYIEQLIATVDHKTVLVENRIDGKAFSVRMCKHTFETFIESLVLRPFSCEKGTFTPNAILSLVCTSISLTFSVFTLIIYLSCEELKNQPGINNIVLCITLIIAQAVFQFGSGQSCNVAEVTCQIIGVLVHFSWLFLIFWMNSCCIHMLRVFRFSKARMALFNTAKTTMIYILYSFSASLIFVLINVIVSLYESEWHHIGYGGSLCYISKGHMVAYLFALPVAAVVCVNIVLYIIVMLQMKNSSKVQSDKNERNLFHIYVRLSTLTGCTWIFGFLSFFLNVTIFDYIFIAINASQGMFLFLAFVANRRTLKLLMNKDETRNNGKALTYRKEGKVTSSASLTK